MKSAYVFDDLLADCTPISLEEAKKKIWINCADIIRAIEAKESERVPICLGAILWILCRWTVGWLTDGCEPLTDYGRKIRDIFAGHVASLFESPVLLNYHDWEDCAKELAKLVLSDEVSLKDVWYTFSDGQNIAGPAFDILCGLARVCLELNRDIWTCVPYDWIEQIVSTVSWRDEQKIEEMLAEFREKL